MTVYDRTFNLPVVFTPQTFSNNLADVLAAHGRTNLRLAETEKYAHVTYFFNCGREEPYPGEDRILVPSQKVATYDLMPEMSAPGIADNLVADLTSRRHQVVICNFANADMVGHTGSIEATVEGRRDARWVPGPDHDSPALGGRDRDRHLGSRQRRADVGRRAEGAAHRAHVEPGAGRPLRRRLRSAANSRMGGCETSRRRSWTLLDIPLAPEMTGRSLIEK